jgi:hypothetical protein
MELQEMSTKVSRVRKARLSVSRVIVGGGES